MFFYNKKISEHKTTGLPPASRKTLQQLAQSIGQPTMHPATNGRPPHTPAVIAHPKLSFNNPTLLGTDIKAAFPFDAATHTAATVHVLTSDASAQNQRRPLESTAGAALVELIAPPGARWGGDTTGYLIEGESPFRTDEEWAQNSLATHAVALRHTRIASADIETWPTDLLEAWPVLQCLCAPHRTPPRSGSTLTTPRSYQNGTDLS